MKISGVGQGRLGRLLEFVLHAIQDFTDFEWQTVGLVDAANLVIAESAPQQAGQLAIAVEPLVVDLDDENMIEAVEDLVGIVHRTAADIFAWSDDVGLGGEAFTRPAARVVGDEVALVRGADGDGRVVDARDGDRPAVGAVVARRNDDGDAGRPEVLDGRPENVRSRAAFLRRARSIH